MAPPLWAGRPAALRLSPIYGLPRALFGQPAEATWLLGPLRGLGSVSRPHPEEGAKRRLEGSAIGTCRGPSFETPRCARLLRMRFQEARRAGLAPSLNNL